MVLTFTTGNICSMSKEAGQARQRLYPGRKGQRKMETINNGQTISDESDSGATFT